MTTPVTIRELVRCMWYHELCGNQRSVPRPSECTKIVGGWGFAPDPTGELTALHQTPLTGFNGSYFKAPTSKGRAGQGKGGEGLPRLEITSGYALAAVNYSVRYV